jgi:hypothetical protein
MTRTRRAAELFASHEVLARTPQIWLDVSAGTISPEAAAEEMSGSESPELIERSKALFAPPPAERERAMRERILDEVAPEVAPARRPWWWMAGGLGALAAVIALAFVLRPPEREVYAPLGVEYQVELSAGLEVVRGGESPRVPEDESVRTYRVDQEIDITLRPSSAIEERELDVVVFAYDERGQGRQLGPPRRLSTSTGTVRLSERPRASGLSPGRWQLVFVIGRVGQVPEEVERFAPGAAQPPATHYAMARATIRVGIDEP